MSAGAAATVIHDCISTPYTGAVAWARVGQPHTRTALVDEMKPMTFAAAVTRRFGHNPSRSTRTDTARIHPSSPEAPAIAVDVEIGDIASGSASTDTTAIHDGTAAPDTNAVLSAVVCWVGVASGTFIDSCGSETFSSTIFISVSNISSGATHTYLTVIPVG